MKEPNQFNKQFFGVWDNYTLFCHTIKYNKEFDKMQILFIVFDCMAIL